MPEVLSGIPSVMVQKTALGQSSPYIRGLTGYHNLLLVDNIRLNHSAMRSGPNQYWSTVEILGSESIEVVRGPNAIIHGADAIGGVVNILSASPTFSDKGTTQSGNFWLGYPLQRILGRLVLEGPFQVRTGLPNSPMWSDPLETWRGQAGR